MPPFAMTEFPDGALDLSTYRATPAELTRLIRGRRAPSNYRRIGFSEDYRQFFGDSPNTSGITAEEMYLLRVYKLGLRGGGANYGWNRALGNGDPEAIAEYAAEIKTLASGLNKLPSFTGTTYRTIALPEKILAKYRKGALVFEPIFTSTSKINYRDLKYDESNVFYEFRLRGRGAHDIDFDGDLESEVLVSPNVAFRVKGTRTIRVPAGYPGGRSREVLRVTLEEVLPEELKGEK